VALVCLDSKIRYAGRQVKARGGAPRQ